MFRIAACVVLLSTVFAPAVLRAQLAPTAAAPVETEKMVIRTYDLTDLFRAARHYPLPPNMVPATGLPSNNPPAGGGMSMFGGFSPGGVPGMEMGGGMAPEPVTPASVTQLIMGTVAPESWRDAGGAIGTMRLIGTRLVVAQTVANHKQIEDLLNSIRDEGGMSYMVSVQAYWVHLTPDDLRAIAGKPVAGDAAVAAALKEVPDTLLTDDKVYSRGQTLGYNGQVVHVASGRANTIVTGMQPVVGTQAVGYQLETATVQSGVALQVTPQVLGDGKLVSLDLHSIVSEVDAGDAGLPDPRVLSTASPTTAPVGELSLGKPARIVAQQFSTTARVPVGRKVLVGGMTFDPGAAADGVKQLYLVVEANAIK